MLVKKHIFYIWSTWEQPLTALLLTPPPSQKGIKTRNVTNVRRYYLALTADYFLVTHKH